MFFGAVNNVRVVVYVSDSNPANDQFPVRVPYIKTARGEPGVNIPIVDDDKTLGDVVKNLFGRRVMAGPRGGGTYLTATIEGFQAASSYPDPLQEYDLKTPVGRLSDTIALWFKAALLDVDVSRHVQNIRNQADNPDQVQEKILLFGLQRGAAAASSAAASGAAESDVAERISLKTEVDRSIECIKNHVAEFQKVFGTLENVILDIQTKQSSTSGKARQEIDQLRQQASVLRAKDFVGDMNGILMSVDIDNDAIVSIEGNVVKLSELCAQAENRTVEMQGLVAQARELNSSHAFRNEIRAKIQCVNDALSSLNQVADAFQAASDETTRAENPPTDPAYNTIIQEAQERSRAMEGIRQETNEIEYRLVNDSIADIQAVSDRMTDFCTHINDAMEHLRDLTRQMEGVRDRTVAAKQAADEAERDRLAKTSTMSELENKWKMCSDRSIAYAEYYVLQSEQNDDVEKSTNLDEESKSDAVFISNETKHLKALLNKVHDLNALVRADYKDEAYIEEKCGVMDTYIRSMREILNTVSPAFAGRAEAGSEWDTGDTVLEQLGSYRLKRYMTVMIQQGLEGFDVPSEYSHFKNKHDWVNALKTSEGRRNLFASLSGLTNHLSNLIAEDRIRFNPLENINDRDMQVSVDTYREFEKLVAWHVLDLIMSTVRFQVSLNFGHERPSEPRHTKLLENVRLSYFGLGYIHLVIIKVFLVLAVSCALFSYVYEPGSGSAKDSFVRQMEESGQATFHEVTFFRGSQHIPLVTFYTPDVAERFESLGGMHWVQFAANQGINDIDLEVHKFITPRITGAFMDFFGDIAGTTWTRESFDKNDFTYPTSFKPFGLNEEDEEAAGEEY
jgi:uncharacterized coiled-coil protein SlyX